jgi:RimJ/RimL family protein N-acetyltransferase
MARIVLSDEPLVEGPTALRPWRDSDIPSRVEICRDSEIVRWTRVPPNYSETDARMFMLERLDEISKGTRAPFAVVSAEDDSILLGSVALMRFAWEHRRAEVGYFMARGARGFGHATRAVRLIGDFGFDRLGLERITLLTATGNVSSQRVAERAGFTREGVLRSYVAGKEGRQNMVVFSLLLRER